MITALEIIFLHTWEQTVLGVLKVVEHPILVLVQVVEEPFLLGFCHIGLWLRYRDHFDSAVTGLRHYLLVDGAPLTVLISLSIFHNLDVVEIMCQAQWLCRLWRTCVGGNVPSIGLSFKSSSSSTWTPPLALSLSPVQRSIILFCIWFFPTLFLSS